MIVEDFPTCWVDEDRAQVLPVPCFGEEHLHKELRKLTALVGNGQGSPDIARRLEELQASINKVRRAVTGGAEWGGSGVEGLLVR